MLKLLVPVDGSDSSLRALQYVIGLAKQNGPIAIHVVIVHEEPAIFGEIAVYVTREKMLALQQQSSQARLVPAEKMLKEAAVPYAVEILTGNTAEVIARRADQLGCAGIVMGTRGMTAIAGLVMGSIATKVVHAAKVPVTLVK